MATVTLKNVKKIYPFVSGEGKKKKKKKDEPEEKKVNLQITIRASSPFRSSTWTSQTRNSSFWSDLPAAASPPRCV